MLLIFFLPVFLIEFPPFCPIQHRHQSAFPGTLLPRDIMPTTVCGKALEMDHHSMKDCVAVLGVNDTWLTAHMLSRAVLGRYHTEVFHALKWLCRNADFHENEKEK